MNKKAETGIDFTQLAQPFPPEVVHWRVGAVAKDGKKAKALAYIDARHVMDRLDSVCGPENWQSEIATEGSRVICRLSIRVEKEWITKSDGAGNTQVEGDKGAISDALKRAAVSWGIGRYLYSIDGPWVAVVPAGKSYRIDQSEFERLQSILPGSQVQTAKKESPDPPVKFTVDDEKPSQAAYDVLDNMRKETVGQGRENVGMAVDAFYDLHMGDIEKLTEREKSWLDGHAKKILKEAE